MAVDAEHAAFLVEPILFQIDALGEDVAEAVVGLIHCLAFRAPAGVVSAI